MEKRFLVGIFLFILGLSFSIFKDGRPWIDYDFFLTWFGFLLITDSVAYYLGKRTIFSNIRSFLLLAFASGYFWWFYEWANIALKNWAYPGKFLYDYTEAAIIGVIAFATVIPHLIISTNIVEALFKKKFVEFVPGRLSNVQVALSVTLGIICFILSIYFSLYFFYLVWLIVFLVLDPINARLGKRSLIIQVWKRNFLPILILTLAALVAGLGWETINHLVPKWIYPIVPWFWNLPASVTTKYVEMPLAGFLGYIPFIFSAFAFIEFLELKIRFFNKN